MLDLRLIREDPDAVRAALTRRRASAHAVDEVLEVDRERRELQASLDTQRSEQRKASKEVPRLQGAERETLLVRLKALSDQIAEREAEADRLAATLRRLMLEIPNIAHDSAPEGASDEANTLVRTWGEPREDPGARDHIDIGVALDVIDIERAVRASGARFGYLKGAAAMMELALVRFAIDMLLPHRFVPVIPPVLVRREAMEGTGFLPTDEAQIYRTADDDLYLVGTSEVPLAALHQDEFLDPGGLPLRYAGFSSCFRREAGTYGKDTRGIFRVHQFDKVEMFSFTLPEQSWDEHEFLLEREEEIVRALGIPYRVVNICAGELGQPAAKKYDIEGWFPGQGAFRELTSCSNCTDYQARRLNARYRTERGPAFVHTLNGTAVAIGRMLIAIVENHQQPDGGVAVPEALRAYCGFERIAPR